MKIQLLAAMVSLLAVDSAVASVTVEDLDGYNRESKYTAGVVNRIVTDSLHARTFNGWLFRNDAYDKCETGVVYDEITGQVIAPVGTTPGGAQAYTVDSIFLQGNFTDEQLQRTRVLAMNCESASGEQFVVKHKIPALPKITWDAQLVGVGPWNKPDCSGPAQHCGGAGWYNEVSYTSSLHINNGTKDGYCTATAGEGSYSKVFNGYDSTPLFHTNHFAVSDVLYKSNSRIFRQEVSCNNPAGTTERLTVWEITGENDINLVVDHTSYK
ncbi:hypothetical protein N474_17630 [Pseudoalteromonas luteoviolacea CPMOR-2]|uniref:Uncharacterized protein n=1 Tax=Pseudoalteromonas luteoviolacea DSM 6061 TaxID=1365250 RepID=A0A166X8H7_9GAMM|nr:hypothetical protein [Pseudoalteromonas luteoviolacea]KZN39802.1 hypothetical protein N475_13665 [Pseudoalteromonas luteoviolacea DSM 6061]KZN54731.1 hypothetical protein N474_17630 [Pseudoalteromonas luteoviolacea CPMOR-2]MBE0385739.1 hypothetical protein [Pseudoalteromonas luteoviolacea DSM 6061]